MNAAEAKEVAIKHAHEELEMFWGRIESAIQIAAHQGHNRTRLDDVPWYVATLVEQRLKGEGFQIALERNPQNSSYTVEAWWQ